MPTRSLILLPPSQVGAEMVLQQAHETSLLPPVRKPSGPGQQRADPFGQGLLPRWTCPALGRLIGQGHQKVGRDPPAVEVLIEVPEHGGLPMMQVDRGGEARPEKQQAYKQSRPRDP